MAGIKRVMRGLVLGCATLAASGTAHAAESADKIRRIRSVGSLRIRLPAQRTSSHAS